MLTGQIVNESELSEEQKELHAVIKRSFKETRREEERVCEYVWVDTQVSKCDREKYLPNADQTAIEAKITALRQYANAVWATQQQADYPQSVTYPNRPTI